MIKYCTEYFFYIIIYNSCIGLYISIAAIFDDELLHNSPSAEGQLKIAQYFCCCCCAIVQSLLRQMLECE